MLPPEPRHLCKTYSTDPYCSHISSAICDISDYCALQILLLTYQFLVDDYLWQFCGITPKPRGNKLFLLQGLECYKGTQTIACEKYDKYVEYWRDLVIRIRDRSILKNGDNR